MTAFAYSINTVAAKLGQEVGFGTVADMARRFGITTPVNTHPSMVLGSSEVHLLDLTRAFASVGNKGVAVTPYGITKVTAGGETIYTQTIDTSHVLVAPYVAAEMTDLLQTTVNTGTGKAAQIGRPVAGKTGTTTSSKDGWFVGFSSGLTTGVWMGRDDARPIAGLHGGTAPAKAFHDFMAVAVASRPVEQFDTQVTLPDMSVEPDEESYYGGPDNGVFVDSDGNPVQGDTAQPQQSQPRGQDRGQRVDEDGNPIGESGGSSDDSAPAQPEKLDQQWMDHVLGRDQQPQQRPRGDRPAAAPPPARQQPGYSDARPNQ